MKKLILSIALLLLTTMMVSAQSYTFGLVRDFNSTGNPHEYTWVMTPDFTDATPNFGSIQLTVAISTGNTLTNYTEILDPFLNDPIVDITGPILAASPFFLGDGSLDLWIFTMGEPSSSPVTAPHMAGVPIPILSFEVANNPTSGTIAILENNDPISVGLFGFGNNVSNIGTIQLSSESSTSERYAGTDPTANSHNLQDPLLSVDDLEFSELALFPNPAVNSFVVQGLQGQINKLSIYDINGAMIQEVSDYNGTAIDTSTLATGVYFVKLENKGARTLQLIKN
ncbi:T9SS type A sorting domain-containing protein [Aquimarina sp. 2201CG14-23]|uniref:T9SS type A sorting domain-containing protein n=1 Tax=Aquimarina mycalae TaxID=3040073 RepID=UPI002477CBE7|nr:T9SS type A sorting domain-containing protein [Aquimarina sp. 2201CG14-23]MDH7447656.1 T9SS type A sorting domain-containing protein [Aquimarina sp. 2201CG14-23]